VKSIALNKFVCACGGGGGGTKTLRKINGTFTPEGDVDKFTK